MRSADDMFDAAADALACEVASPVVEPSPALVAECGRIIEAHGWRRDVAGEADFAAAALACAKASANRRGLFVSGPAGCGKTALVRALAASSRRRGEWVRLGDVADADRLDARAWPNWNRDVLGVSVILDDLGAESLMNDFGERRELAGEFIVRYHRGGRRRLYVTTNLTAEQMYNRYGPRVCSRIMELTFPLVLNGADKRCWTKGSSAARTRLRTTRRASGASSAASCRSTAPTRTA